MTTLDPSLYSVIWFAPLEIEAQAAVAMLDHLHDGHFPLGPGDDHVFRAGDIAGYNVVITSFPAGQEYGTSTAAALAGQVKAFFPSLRFGLLVGVAAGFPDLSQSPPRDIRLGDVLVALSCDDRPAVIPYGLGKETRGDDFQLLRSGHVLAQTKTLLRSAIGSLKAEEPYSEPSFREQYGRMMHRKHATGDFRDPGQHRDCYHADGRSVTRSLRPRSGRTRVWYGSIGSGDKLVKNAAAARQMRDRHQIIGVEMEAAGIMNQIPVAVIRGVCDYGDEYKNSEWQPYAAAMAAAYAKTILGRIPSKGNWVEPVQKFVHLTQSRVSTDDHALDKRFSMCRTPSSRLPAHDPNVAMEDETITPRAHGPKINHETTTVGPLAELWQRVAGAPKPQAPYILHQLVLYIASLWTIPRAITSKIIIADFLGRELHLSIPMDWYDLAVILLPFFDTGERYGLEKVRSGEFIIVYCDTSEKRFKRLGPTNWANEIQHGRKLHMSVVISYLRLEDQVCTSCRCRVKRFRSFITCPNCGLFALCAQQEQRKLTATEIAVIPSLLSDGLLRVPRAIDPPTDCLVGLYASYEDGQRGLQHDLLANRSTLSMEIGGAKGDFQPIIPHSIGASSIDSSGNAHRLSRPPPEDASASDDESSEEEYPIIEVEISPRGMELREREIQEISHFKKVFIQEDNLLYDEALEGNLPAVVQRLPRLLKIPTFDMNETWGPLGTPLTAAILSGSDSVVDVLLQAGADPFFQAGPLDFPLRAAAVFGNSTAVELILSSTMQKSIENRPGRLQEALDQSLYSVVETGHRSLPRVFLYAGANPFATVDGKRSAFAFSTFSQPDLAAQFVTEAYARGLLQLQEAELIIDAVYRRYAPVPSCPGWLDACCRNVEMGRTEGVEKRIVQRLTQSPRTSFLLWEPLWRTPRLNRRRTVRALPVPEPETVSLEKGCGRNSQLPVIQVTMH
ncbi:purine and uridine phosphorylase [Aspergillus campestris IBT 28561]|uniref:Purine and uridine phosphorylase n=1 Tax=Aspergillus campestris (strain IBT 28561) TaxID=1392248 RepID=A0A2I1CQY3_ASPC2|nr:purine and uridine phosphorylase [Aspergillus campestris IBT 28561]PKY00032.1 purine and uridine phosphorylase [Aspergillus campestris IBT 28561]